MRRSYFSAAVALLVSAILVPVAWGDIITPRDSTGARLADGVKFRMVFVTAETDIVSTGALAYYNGKVDTSAGAADWYSEGTATRQAVTWNALVGVGSTSFATTFNGLMGSEGSAWWLYNPTSTSDTKVRDWSDPLGALDAAISRNAAGALVTGTTPALLRVWTGSATGAGFGVPGTVLGGTNATYGRWNTATDPEDGYPTSWRRYGAGVSEGTGGRLYAVSNELTAVPEPGCLTLWALALVVGGGYGIARRRRSVASATV